ELQPIYYAGTTGKCKPGISPTPTPTPDNSVRLSYITPNHGGDNGVVSAAIYGSNIPQGSSVKLTRAGQADITGSETSVSLDGRSVTTRFDLTGKELGAWDVVVTAADSRSAMIPAGFTVERGTDPDVWIDLVGRYTFRSSATERMFLVYGNNGNVDSPGTYLRFFVPAPMIVTDAPMIDGSLPNKSVDTEGTTLEYYVASVHANSSAAVPIVLTAPDSLAHRSIDLDLGVMTGSDLEQAVPGIDPTQHTTFDNVSSSPNHFTFRVNTTGDSGPQVFTHDVTLIGVDNPLDTSVTEEEIGTDLRVTVDATVPADLFPDAVSSNGTVQGPSPESSTRNPFFRMIDVVTGPVDHWVRQGRLADERKKRDQMIIRNMRRTSLHCLQGMGVITTATAKKLESFQRAKRISEFFNGPSGIIAPNELGGVVEAYGYIDPLLDESFWPTVQQEAKARFLEDGENLVRLHPELAAVRQAAFETGNNFQWTVMTKCHAVKVKRIGRNLVVVFSWDPNDKDGPQGAGTAHFISGTQPSNYAVYFENLSSATAPVQKAVVTDQLDISKLDPATFSLESFAFGGRVVPVPDGASDYTVDVDMRPDKNLIVRITSDLDETTGLLTVTYLALDPTTMLPVTDPSAGFLPPNHNSPEGQGVVMFRISPRPGLGAGTEIRNHARIVFDNNAPIETPDWVNTVDNSKPASSVTSVVKSSCGPDLSVSWSGTDTGSGIASYSIFVSDNGGPYSEWQTETAAGTASYSGTAGHSYSFYSVARDGAGNTEDVPSTPDVSVTASANTPPVLGYTNQSLNIGSSLSVNPSIAPTDNGSVQSITLLNAGTYTGGISVNNATGLISLSNAGPAGTHTVVIRATDNCGLTNDASFQVTVNNTAPKVASTNVSRSAGSASLSANIAIATDAEQAAGTLAVKVNGGASATANNVTVANLAISPNGIISALISTPCNASTATFTITATDNGSLTSSTPVTVTIIPPPTTPTAGSNSPVVVGGTLALSASSIAGANYAWSGPGGFNSALQNPSITNVTLAASGTYNVTASINGCMSPAASTLVVVNPAPTPTPTPTPSGTDIVFASNRDSFGTQARHLDFGDFFGNFEIYGMRSNGTGIIRLTNNNDLDLAPALSPDKQKIAFMSERGGHFDIYTMNVNGTGLTRLTTASQFDGFPSWSPDGTKIVFQSDRAGNAEIYVMNANGTGVTRLTTDAALDTMPAWSPNGAKIAFVSMRNGNSEIYSMNPNGSGVTRLTNDRGIDASPSWSPDSSKIAFMSTRDLGAEIYVMNANGSGVTRLTNNAFWVIDTDPSWGANGKILFSSTRNGASEIYVMNANGTLQTRLTSNFLAWDISPKW
ncbi:MAG: PD40 domain-containing protein, partial [Acidobacteria bacterium]|nr:PD40 domain-containing protein [Acidobacteriota bacterium]